MVSPTQFTPFLFVYTDRVWLPPVAQPLRTVTHSTTFRWTYTQHCFPPHTGRLHAYSGHTTCLTSAALGLDTKMTHGSQLVPAGRCPLAAFTKHRGGVYRLSESLALSRSVSSSLRVTSSRSPWPRFAIQKSEKFHTNFFSPFHSVSKYCLHTSRMVRILLGPPCVWLAYTLWDTRSFYDSCPYESNSIYTDVYTQSLRPQSLVSATKPLEVIHSPTMTHFPSEQSHLRRT